MRVSKILLLIILVFIFLVFSVGTVFAADWWPLVPCGLKARPEGGDPNWPNYTNPCTRCDGFRLVKNVIDFVLEGLVPPLAAGFFILGGFFILLGGANPKTIALGKTIFWNTFWGAVIILASWMIVNTLIKSFGPDQIKSSWNTYLCKDSTIAGPAVPPGPGDICLRPQELARQNNVVYPTKNAPELDQLISCIQSKLVGQNLGSIYTFDEDDPVAPKSSLCNYTRGKETCSKCSHSVNSCHYGGGSGSQGAMAVDFGNEQIGDKIIQAAKQCQASDARCETATGQKVACTSSSPKATHVHVNSKSCSD